jgi:hypothetical protein
MTARASDPRKGLEGCGAATAQNDGAGAKAASGPPSSADGGIHAAFSFHLVGADYGKPSVCHAKPGFLRPAAKNAPKRTKKLSVNRKLR